MGVTKIDTQRHHCVCVFVCARACACVRVCVLVCVCVRARVTRATGGLAVTYHVSPTPPPEPAAAGRFQQVGGVDGGGGGGGGRSCVLGDTLHVVTNR